MNIEFGHYGTCSLSVTEENQVVLADEEGAIYTSFRSEGFKFSPARALAVARRATVAWLKVSLWFPQGHGTAVNYALAFAGYGDDKPEGADLRLLGEEEIIPSCNDFGEEVHAPPKEKPCQK